MSIEINGHIWGFGNCVITAQSEDNGGDYQANIFQRGKLFYERVFKSIPDDFDDVTYRIFIGVRPKLIIPDIYLYKSEIGDINSAGSMRTITNKFFKIINTYQSSGLEPEFKIKINIDHDNTLTDDDTISESEYIQLEKMYLDMDELTIDDIVSGKMYGQKIDLKFVCKRTYKTISTMISDNYDYLSIIDDGTEKDITITINTTDYKLRIIGE